MVSEVGEEGGEGGFIGKVNNYGFWGYGCMRNSCVSLIFTSNVSAPE